MRGTIWGLGAALVLSVQPADGTDVLLHGKVVMEDGSPPERAVSIERQCHGAATTSLIATTNKKGEFTWFVAVNSFGIESLGSGYGFMGEVCFLKANLSGYESTMIDLTDRKWSSDPTLPTLILMRRGSNSNLTVFTDTGAPGAASKTWSQAAKAAQARNWPEAERLLRATVQSAPQFSQGWNALGLICQNQRKMTEAREAYQRAIETNPKLLPPYLLLARANLVAKDWEGAVRVADALIKADTKRLYPEIYLHKASGQYRLKDFNGAEASVAELMRLDRKHQFARAEYLLGLILEAKQNHDTAGEHMRRYLELEPKAADAEPIRLWIENLGKPQAAELAMETSLDMGLALGADGEAWVPGGMKALAALAHSAGTLSYRNFFLDYCRALAGEISLSESKSYVSYPEFLQAYMSSVSELSRLGERRGDSTVVTLSLTTDAQRKNAERILPLLGWRMVAQKDEPASIELGDREVDGFRQPIPALLGIDEIDMQEALDAGRSYQFEVPSENARLIGGDAWSEMLKKLPAFPGGLAEAFARDPRLARTYAGLGAMGADTAAAVVSSVGLPALVTRYSDVLAFYSPAFALSKGEVLTPGGPGAEAIWRRIAGASPKDPAAFFRALLEKDHGKLAAFYFALWRSDAAHQRFFTRTAPLADRFYAWYRLSEELQDGPGRHIETWRPGFFQKLPLDVTGNNVRFPGGRRAWTTSSAPDGDVLLDLDSLEALVPLAQLEDRRKAPLDEGSAKLLAQHYTEWSSLFPYFEKLPGLGRAEFDALAAFSDAVDGYPPVKKNLVLGEWHSLVEIIARGTTAGSLDTRRSARAFRSICDGLRAPDHSAKALEALREIASGGGDVDEAVPGSLLRLSGERRAAFDRIKDLQRVPRISALSGSSDAAKTVAALSGLVYAASLDPEGLLVNEDPHLLSKHKFFAAAPNDKLPALFSASTLKSSSSSPGSYFSGGFTNFAEVASSLAHGGKIQERTAPAPINAEGVAGPSAPTEAVTVPTDVVFQASGRLVEVYATITDHRGRYADDLSREQFEILDQGSARQIVAFESRSSKVSCVLLLDTTGSMQMALPSLKNAALKLIGELGPCDSVAVYGFNDAVSELQAFTTDKNAAKRAVLRTRATGNTALYDALTRVNRDLAGRTGKKVIVVFTDGDDNWSTLTADTAIQRAKAAGVPIYTIAQGTAVTHPAFIKQLAGISKATGGVSFVIREPKEIRGVFEHVSEDLMHGYLLEFQPPPAHDRAWRGITVVVSGSKNLKVRAREGYYPD
jgi:Ca-activated chloride channel family protein